MRVVSMVVLAAALGCGPSLAEEPREQPGSSPEQQPEEVGEGPDAGPAPTACSPTTAVDEGYGTISDLVAANTPYDEGANVWQVSYELDDGVEWQLRLHPGLGQVGDPIAAGSYTIDPDTPIQDCDVCVLIRSEGPEGVKIFAAQEGALTIDDVERDRFPDIDIISGTLVESLYREVEIQAVGPSCTDDAQCGHLDCADNGQCEVEVPGTSCGTTIGEITFFTP